MPGTHKQIEEHPVNLPEIDLEKIFNSIPVAIFVKNKKFEYITCNQELVHILNLSSKDEIIGKTDEILGLQEAEPNLCKTGDQDVLTTKTARLNVEETLLLPNGKRLVLLVSKIPILDNLNNVTAVLGCCIDITNRKSVEQTFLEEIIAKMPGYVFWKNKQLVYMGCNDNLIKDAGLATRSDLIGKTDLELPWGKSHGGTFQQDDFAIMEAGVGKLGFEETLLKADGQLATVLTNKIPLKDEQGKVSGILAISSDITDRKRIEEELLEAKERAEAANRAKSEFLATVSHELRIPLTGIIGMASLLNMDNLQSEQHSQVEDILKAGEHLLSLVNDLLDLTKLQAGKMELHPASVDLKQLIDDIINMMSFQADSKGVELLVDYGEDVPSFVLGDTRAIRQILLNLLGNALKFTDKGHILIKIRSVEICDKTITLEFRVEDTGIGIPQDKLKLIFDRFAQVQSTYGRQYGGTGLGLTLSKHLIELMGGNIDVESELGKGSTFFFTISLGIQETSDTKSSWDAYKTKVRILIIDDTLRSQILAKHIASSNTCITEGKDALQKLLVAKRRNEGFDIVIIDQQLTSADAMQLGEAINEQFCSDAPMLLLLVPPSANIAKKAAKSRGFFDCFTKPIKSKELLKNLTAAWKQWIAKNTLQDKMAFFADRQPLILLVEDDVIVQKVHKLMLEKAGCKVEVASDGNQALAMASNHYDAIFMDVGLPGMSGLEATQQIRQREINHKHTPIIAMTAYVHDGDRNNCLAAGMDDVATKPIALDALKQILSRWIEHER
jgi:PAS domain S-box-containing protein